MFINSLIKAFGTKNRIYEKYLEKEFSKRGPWVTQFMINSKAYGGYYRVWEDIRPKQFFEKFPTAKTILDIGSLEGGQTFQLAKHPGVEVIGFEGRQDNIDRANFVKNILGIKNVRFELSNIEIDDITRYGKFDAVFCSGVLYHLPESWALIEQLSKITSNLFLWTHYASDTMADQVSNGYRGWWYNEGGLDDPLAGLSTKSFWLTMEALKKMLACYQFESVNIIKIDTAHENGPCVTMVATKANFA